MAKQPTTKNPAPTDAPKPDSPAPKATSRRPEDAPHVVRKVFILVHTTGGNRAALADVPLHEVPLLRKKIPALGGNELKVLGEWPATADRIRGLNATQLREEYEVLRDRYTYDKPGGREGDQVDLMMDVYGPLNQGRLVTVMRRLEKAWVEMERGLEDGKQPTEEQIEEILALAEPEHDFETIPADGFAS